MEAQKEEFLLKVVLNGPTQSGKTQILNKFAQDKFNETYIATVGIEFTCKTIEIGTNLVKLQIWDTAGQEKFRSISRLHYRGAAAIVTIFDLTSENSFKDVDKFVQEAKQITPFTHYFLIGNKVDLTTQRAVTFEVANTYAQKNGMIYQEVSAKNGFGILSCFELIVRKLLKLEDQKTEDQSGSILCQHLLRIFSLSYIQRDQLCSLAYQQRDFFLYLKLNCHQEVYKNQKQEALNHQQVL